AELLGKLCQQLLSAPVVRPMLVINAFEVFEKMRSSGAPGHAKARDFGKVAICLKKNATIKIQHVFPDGLFLFFMFLLLLSRGRGSSQKQQSGKNTRKKSVQEAAHSHLSEEFSVLRPLL